MARPTIRFDSIRVLNTSQRDAFEELCVQLAEAIAGEELVQRDRIRGAGGDEGVEAVVRTASGRIIGIQSKFFLGSLRSTQWKQIDRSVHTAAQKHPELTHYFVCVTTDRTPADVKRWESMLLSWATSFPMLTVEWHGASELMHLLVTPRWAYLATYWLGRPEFTFEWMKRRCDISIKQLHQRYTPQLHQLTHAEQDFRLLLGLGDALGAYRSECAAVAVQWKKLLASDALDLLRKELAGADATILDSFRDRINGLLCEFCDGDLLAQGNAYREALSSAIEAAEILEARAWTTSEPRKKNDSGRHSLRRLASELSSLSSLSVALQKKFDRYRSGRVTQLCILDGDAGTGKSHLLATLVQDLLREGRGCVMLIGERFKTSDPLTIQIPLLLSWQHSFRDLCECMEAHAATVDQPSILVVDAINESIDKRLWRRELHPILNDLRDFSRVQLVLSCRTDWLQACLPAEYLKRAVRVEHRGFDMRFHEAVAAYFNGYRVTSPQYPPLLPEFRNPLFLKTLCEAYEGRTLPAVPLAFTNVIQEWESRLATHIEENIDCPVSTVKTVMQEIVIALAETETRLISEEQVQAICRRHFPDSTASGSLYRHLCSQGLLQNVECDGETLVRLQYERFSDIRVAELELQKFNNRKEWISHWKEKLLPDLLEKDYLKYEAVPRLFAYALLLPEHLDLELIECPIACVVHNEFARSSLKQALWEAWIDALPWRQIALGDEQIVRYFARWANQLSRESELLHRLLQFSSIERHPLNAEFLHRNLLRQELFEREIKWTIPLAREDITPDEGNFLGEFIDWTFSAAGRSSEEQAYLAALALVWLTSSTNKALRNRATIAAITILAGKHDALMRLVNSMWDVNDPYVKERLLAVAAGVIPALPGSKGKKDVAEQVLQRFFQQGSPPPHLLQREYARFIVEFAVRAGAIHASCRDYIRPPFTTIMPTIWSERKVKEYEDDDEFFAISSSLRPEEMDYYGHFGRYVMGSVVHKFVDPAAINLEAKDYYERFPQHDARIARRYIWQRIIQFGWTPERFRDYERRLPGISHASPNIERISKKYQWIGLYEYLGYLSDTHLYRSWNDETSILQGAWQINCRDFDPSIAEWHVNDGRTKLEDDEPPLGFPTSLRAATSTHERREWVQGAFNSFDPYLSLNISKMRWLVLYAHMNFDEPLAFGYERYKTDLMSQWINVRAVLLPKEGFTSQIKKLKSITFFGHGLDVPHAYDCWLSEYPWHLMLKDVDEACRSDDTRFGPIRVPWQLTACQIANEDRCFYVPPPSLYEGISQTEGAPLSSIRPDPLAGYRINNASGQAIFLGSSAGAPLLLVREDSIRNYLQNAGLRLVWAVLSERMAWNGHQHVGGVAHQSAVYSLEAGGRIAGGFTVHEATPPEKLHR